MTGMPNTEEGMKKPGRWLKECRERTGMSRGTLAVKLGTTYETIRLYEEGKRAMKIDRFLEILTALDIPLDGFLSQTEW